MKKLAIGTLLAILALLALPSLAAAAVPGFVPVQGILTDSAGDPLDSEVDVTFTLYDSADTSLHTETVSVTPEAGFFSVALGDNGTALDLTIFRDNAEVELGIQVGTDAEMTPRLQFGSVPYAVSAEWAADAQTLDGNTMADVAAMFVGAGETDSVTGDMIADGTITTADVDNAIPLYRVSNTHCEEPPGTLMADDSCHANQANVSSCPSCSGTTPRKFRRCDGSCGCGLLIACPISGCTPRTGAPSCPNQPINAYGLAP